MTRTALVCCLMTALTTAPAQSDDMPERLPVGDGKVSSTPKVGHVMACNQNFRSGGARHVGDWYDGKTWSPSEKPHVEGRVAWPDAQFDVTASADALKVTGNGLPVGQLTGSFPIQRSDPAYAYDTNPNPILQIALDFTIPRAPRKAAEPGCLSMGMIGFTTTGVALYNALDDAGLDAAAHEVQDLCNGHPQGKGQYHYHNSSPCVPGADRNAHVGWALDGYPILGMRDAGGALLDNADLDACHGRAEPVSIGGLTYDYAYRLTAEYPYILGCYTGQVLPATTASIRAQMGPPRQQVGRGQRHQP